VAERRQVLLSRRSSLSVVARSWSRPAFIRQHL